MAISPPSDLVLDVVRAADPAAVQEAQAKLKSNRASFEATSLAEAGAGFNSAVGILNRDSAVSAKTTDAVRGTAIPETYRKFEAMVLQNFVKSMLPADNEEIYGKGTAGEMWRSMMADEIGQVISKRGGIGIASSLMKDAEVDNAVGTKAVNGESVRGASTAMVQEMQRNVFADLTPGVKTGKQA